MCARSAPELRAAGRTARARSADEVRADRLCRARGDDVGAADVQADSRSEHRTVFESVAALLVIVFGFLFVTVSCRICGLIGTSSNPVSGMTIATLMATCAMFLVTGWTGGAYAALAITIGGVVAIAAANAGATSQDLKTGYLVGATP